VVEEYDVIDQIGLTPDGHAGLMMFEHRDWIDPSRQVSDLQRKVQAYFSFVVDGDMAASQPDLVGKPVWFRLVCEVPPPAIVRPVLLQMRDLLASHEIDFQVAHFVPGDPVKGVNNLIDIGSN
jgi:hypothetical protein